ncbi:MFS transporter [Kineococcus sp. SYSU DK018]|uniref:MFS transporter n=1 Tax=Kineococcus sp. SYSU DK018 TaxID=3383139 RepID=UPI003D7EDA4F
MRTSSGFRLLLLATVCAVAVANVYATQPVLELIGADLELAPRQLGWIVAVGQVGYLFGLLLLVPLGDVLERRTLIAAHLFLVGAGAGSFALAPSALLAFVGLGCAGLFAVVVQTTVAYTASSAQPHERGHHLGAVTSGVVVGILGSRVLAGLLAQAWGWRSIYLVLAASSLLLALLVLTVLPAEPRGDARPEHDVPGRRASCSTGRGTAYRGALSALAALPREPLFLGRALIAFFLFASFGTLWSGLALPLSAAPWHLDPAHIGLFGIAGLAGALGAGRAGRWADAGHAVRTSGLALVVLIASWLAIGQAGWSLGLLVLGVLILDFAVQAVHVGNQHELTHARPERASTLLAGYMVFYSLGSALGATATTSAFAAAGWTGSSLLGTTFAACALMVWALSRREETTHGSEEPVRACRSTTDPIAPRCRGRDRWRGAFRPAARARVPPRVPPR